MGIKDMETIYDNEFFSLHKCRDGFWLYDMRAKMNLAMRAESEHEALIEAFEYNHRRLDKFEKENKKLKEAIKGFVVQFVDDEDNIDFDQGDD